jgi:hypothetical protein
MDRDHRLEFEDVLRAFVRPDVKVGVVLEWRDGEIADGIPRLPGNLILVCFADGIVLDPGFVGSRLLGACGFAGQQ